MNLNLLRKALLLMATGMLSMMYAPIANAADGTINDQVVRQKEVDNGGSGRYRAIVVSEKTLPDFTVYRPRDVQFAARREGALPILIWCNGACSGSSIGYERMLNEMASHGYVVVGIGSFEMVDSERDDGGSSETMVVNAINWLVRQSRLKNSDYYKAIDVNNIALSGHSCGGAQAIANCANTRVKTLLIMNAGMGGMAMGGASPETLNSLHCPIIYMTGGTGDVAYENAKSDYAKVKKPVVWADLSTAGHGGTYWNQYGGEFGRIALKWMDWHLKGYKQNARIFLKPDLAGFSSNWSVKSRNFSAQDKDYDAPFKDVETVTQEAFDRAAADDKFDFGADVSSVSVLTNQGQKYYDKEGQQASFFPLLKDLGINSIRLRVLVNPSDQSYDWIRMRALANKALPQDFNLMLALHYSDWWGEYIVPAAWKDYDLDELLARVKTYTSTLMKGMAGKGKLRWVQIGNETDNGMMWETGRNTNAFVSIINTAHDAIKSVNPDAQTVIHVSECENLQWLTNYFDTLQSNGAKWDAIGLSVHVEKSTLEPNQLIDKVVENVKALKERYGKPVLIVETGYYIDRPVEANQWLCDFLVKLMEAGASGLYYWEPELTEDYNLGAWNPLTRKPSIVMDAFLGLRHVEGTADGISAPSSDTKEYDIEYYTPAGLRIDHPARGVNIVRKKYSDHVETYKVFQK